MILAPSGAACERPRAVRIRGVVRPSFDALHVQLLPWGPTLRAGVWCERWTDLRALHAQGSHARAVKHPAVCPEDASPLPLPAAVLRQEVFVALPSLSNGAPVPLPALMASLGAQGTRFHGRAVSTRLHRLPLRVPTMAVLARLRPALHAWSDARGEGTLAPGARAVRALLDDAYALVREGPLLPTLAPPPGSVRLDARELPAERLGVAWVPPVSLERLFAWRESLAAVPTLGAAVASQHDPGHEGTPLDALKGDHTAPFAWFITELLAGMSALHARLPALDEAARAALYRRLCDGDLARTHADLGSCLAPGHPVFAPGAPPTLSLEMRVAPLAWHAKGTSTWRATLHLTGDGEIPVRALLRHPLRRATLIAEGGPLRHAGAALAFHLKELIARAPEVFTRPEVLVRGETVLDDATLQRLNALAPLRPAPSNWRALVAGLGHGAAASAKGIASLRISAGERTATSVRVRWDPIEIPEAQGAVSLFDGLRLVPTVTVVLDADELTPEDAAALLKRHSGPWVPVGERLVPRADLEGVLELARAREKVYARLGTSGVSWRRVVELEDRDDEVESIFSAQWERFLQRLRTAGEHEPFALPAGFKGALRPYQKRGAAWLAFLAGHGLGACLADDMGIGKTVQLLAVLLARREGARDLPPSLVVAPTSVVNNWAREAARFTPSLVVRIHQGSARVTDPAGFARSLEGCDVVLTSYPLLQRDRACFEPLTWDLVVADEAQNVKNPEAYQTRALKALGARARIALTGTPVENRLRDLWSLYDLVMPGLLGGMERFGRAFEGPIRRGDEGALARLRARVSPFLLRRTKRDPGVADDLPPRVEQRVDCALTREQAALYRALYEATFTELSGAPPSARRFKILAALTGLKQICNHPENYARERPKRLLRRSGKLDRALELIDGLVAESAPTLVFTQYVAMAEILRDALRERLGIEAPVFHGGLDAAARDEMVRAFQSDDGPMVMIVSLKAGGTGLNLTRATAVVHYDRWWNPAVEDQATDRAHRIGQRFTVNVFRFVTRGTLEERIDEMLAQKRALGEAVIGEGGETWLTEMSDEALRGFLRLDEDTAEDES